MLNWEYLKRFFDVNEKLIYRARICNLWYGVYDISKSVVPLLGIVITWLRNVGEYRICKLWKLPFLLMVILLSVCNFLGRSLCPDKPLNQLQPDNVKN